MLTIFNWFRNHKTIAAWCAYIWAAIIFAACLIPGRDVPSLSIFQYDKIIPLLIESIKEQQQTIIKLKMEVKVGFYF